jgi:4-hydroxymandelate oxidase
VIALANLQAFEDQARRVLDAAHFDYFAGGADDEITLGENVAAFRRILLRPRVLHGRDSPALDVTILGRRLAMPIVVAPTAFHRLAHDAGECATARAAQGAGSLMIVSMAATTSLEQIVAAMDARRERHLWFQIYLQPDRAFTVELVRRAEAAGCSALVVTIDSPCLGNHGRDVRNGFTDLPPGLRCENMQSNGEYRRIEFDAGLDWDAIDWLRGVTRLPIVLKGITHPEDARRSIFHGCNGVIVSNHGGRQLDSVAASIDLLPAVVAAVAGETPVILDGGIRRGTDVLKALALGAAAVGIGRPILWGLAVAGEAGVGAVLDLLKRGLADALALSGCESPGKVAAADIIMRKHAT